VEFAGEPEGRWLNELIAELNDLTPSAMGGGVEFEPCIEPDVLSTAPRAVVVFLMEKVIGVEQDDLFVILEAFFMGLIGGAFICQRFL
jgi:hypothetical protein